MSYTHGTSTAYFDHGCRCDPCREYHNSRVARSRAERLASGNLNHGTRSAYDAGCRCGECREARHQAVITVDRASARRRRQVEVPR